MSAIRVGAYCRVSTDKEDQANSLVSQRQYFQDYIKRYPDWELFQIYADEGITGTSTKKRTQFNRMIQDAREGNIHLILTKEVSRFSRNILDTISYTRQLKNMDVGVIFMNDGIDTREPDAELRLSIMGTIAQEESRKTSSRVVWGQTRQMEKGVVFGHSMLGYDVSEGNITINPEGAKLVRLIFQKYASEKCGTEQIARFLTDRGYVTPGGNHLWRANSIVKILKNEKYVGDLVQKKTYTPDYLTHEKKRNSGQVPIIRIKNHHEPIISREIWNLAQKRLQENRRQKGISGHSNRYIFSGKIRCGLCGATFVCRYKSQKDGRKLRRWQCATAGCGIGKLVRDDDAMWMLKTAISRLPVDLDGIAEDVTKIVASSRKRGGNLRGELERIQNKRERLLDNFLDGTIGKDDMNVMMEKYNHQLEMLTQKSNSESIEPHTITEEITNILIGKRESEVFYKAILANLTVYHDRRMELKLKNLPQIFVFT